MEKKYAIWKKIECNIRGCQEDESESRTYNTTIIVVPEEEAERFGENIADDCGYQDYNYQVDYKRLAELSENELKQLEKAISKELVGDKQ